MKERLFQSNILLFATALGMVSLQLMSCTQQDYSGLPPIPEFSSEGFLPIVVQQLDDARQEVEQRPYDAQANGAYAMVLHAYEQLEPSAVMYARAAMLDSKPFRWFYLMSHPLAATGRSNAAIEALEQAIQIDGEDPWALMRYVLLRQANGIADPSGNGVVKLAQLSKLHKTLPELHYALGRLYSLEGKFDQSITHYKRALELAGDFGAAHYGLGMAYQRDGDADKAQFHITRSQQFKFVVARGQDPYLAAVEELNWSDISLIKRAEGHINSGELDVAIALLVEAIARNKDSVAAHISLIGLYSTQGQFDQAEEHYRLARELQPERAKLYYNFGLMRIMQRRFVEAEEAFHVALQKDRTNPDAYIQLALSLSFQGRDNEARGTLRRAIKLDPANRAARLQLAEILMKDKSSNPQQVIDLLEGYYEPPDGGSAHILLVLAKAYNQSGDHGSAIQSSERGIELATVWKRTALINQFRRQQQLANKK